MAKIFYDQDADLGHLQDKTIAVIGYGSQGHAQAQNLRDSGLKVIIGLREGSSSWSQADADGFEVFPVNEASRRADVIQVLIPDDRQARVYEGEIKPHLREGDSLAFSHGFTIHYHQVVPPPHVDVFMVAPKSPGHRFREHFRNGEGVPGLVAVHQDYTGEAWNKALAYARGVGCTRAGVIQTTFKEETETDLFGEQTVLCGGVSSLIKAGFEVLTEAGYQPEVAYFECLHELKLIVDLIYLGGLEYMRYSISDTAQYGDLTVGPTVITEDTKETMRAVLNRIRSGEFAREWILENQANRPVFNALNEMEKEHPIEEVGRRLREMMVWLKKR